MTTRIGRIFAKCGIELPPTTTAHILEQKGVIQAWKEEWWAKYDEHRHFNDDLGWRCFARSLALEPHGPPGRSPLAKPCAWRRAIRATSLIHCGF